MDHVLNFIEEKAGDMGLLDSAINNYKNKRTFEQRLNESSRIREKYPDRIPIIVCRSRQCKTVPAVDRNKYLVPMDLTAGQFMYVLRQRIKLEPHISIYLMIGDMTIPASSQMLGTLYHEHMDKDGFMYITYTGESTFG